jgi:hypothetical protein
LAVVVLAALVVMEVGLQKYQCYIKNQSQSDRPAREPDVVGGVVVVAGSAAAFCCHDTTHHIWFPRGSVTL